MFGSLHILVYVLVTYLAGHVIAEEPDCVLIRPDGKEVIGNEWYLINIDDTSDTLATGTEIYYFNTSNIKSVTSDDVKYLDFSFSPDDNKLNIILGEQFPQYEETNVDLEIQVMLTLVCNSGKQFALLKTKLKVSNKHWPVFDNPDGYKYNLNMPFPANIQLTHLFTTISAKDLDLTFNQLTFALDLEGAEMLKVDAVKGNSSKLDYKVQLTTKKLINFEDTKVLTLTATDNGEPTPKTKTVSITLQPDVDSTPPTPRFELPLYSADLTAEITENTDITFGSPIKFVEGFHSDLTLELKNSVWATNFNAVLDDTKKEVIIKLTKPITEDILNEPAIVLVLEVTRKDALYTGRTTIHFTLPEKDCTITTEPTPSTTECPTAPSTTVCPICPETTTVPECPTTTTTSEPTTVTCPSCPETTTAANCPTTLTCPNCPETTTVTDCPTTTCPETTTVTDCPTTCPETTTIVDCPSTCPETTSTEGPDYSTSSGTPSSSAGTAPPTGVQFDEVEYLFMIDPNDLDKLFQVSAKPVGVVYTIRDAEEAVSKGVEVNETTGELRVQATIAPGKYIFKVFATLNGGDEDQTTVTLLVQGLGLNVVLFSIPEQSPYVLLPRPKFQGQICSWHELYVEPEGQGFFTLNSGTGAIETPGIDRELEAFRGMPVVQVKARWKIVDCQSSYEGVLNYILGQHTNLQWAQGDCLPSEVTVLLTIEDVNDHSPEFESALVVVGYPEHELISRVQPEHLAIVQATDLDAGFNGTLRYSSENETVVVHPITGAVYPRDGKFKYVDGAKFSITATDRNGSDDGRSSSVLVEMKLLKVEHITVLTVEGLLPEDVKLMASEASTLMQWNVQALSAYVVTEPTGGSDSSFSVGHPSEVQPETEEPAVVKPTQGSETWSGFSGQEYETQALSNSTELTTKADAGKALHREMQKELDPVLLRVAIFALDGSNELITANEINKKLKSLFTTRWRVSSAIELKNSDFGDPDSYSQFFVATIVLASTLLVLLVAAAVTFYLIRRRKLIASSRDTEQLKESFDGDSNISFDSTPTIHVDLEKEPDAYTKTSNVYDSLNFLGLTSGFEPHSGNTSEASSYSGVHLEPTPITGARKRSVTILGEYDANTETSDDLWIPKPAAQEDVLKEETEEEIKEEGENSEEDMTTKRAGARKSVLTFNDDVQVIEIDRL